MGIVHRKFQLNLAVHNADLFFFPFRMCLLLMLATVARKVSTNLKEGSRPYRLYQLTKEGD